MKSYSHFNKNKYGERVIMRDPLQPNFYSYKKQKPITGPTFQKSTTSKINILFILYYIF